MGFRIAHDGRHVAFGGIGLWLYDPVRDVSVRIKENEAPWLQVWSPDDREIAIPSGPSLSIVPLDGGESKMIRASADEAWADPVDWSSDGAIYFVREPAEQRPQWELWRHDLVSSRNEHVVTGPGNVLDARTSPDGKWIAWESDASGRREIYIGARAGSPTPVRVSKAGGGSPRWRRDGRELFFISGDGHIAAVNVELGASAVVRGEHNVSGSIIHPEPFGTDPFLTTRFDVSPDGNRILMQLPPDAKAHSLTLIQGWQSRIAH